MGIGFQISELRLIFLTEMIRVVRSNQQSAISNQQSAISNQQSAISNQQCKIITSLILLSFIGILSACSIQANFEKTKFSSSAQDQIIPDETKTLPDVLFGEVVQTNQGTPGYTASIIFREPSEIQITPLNYKVQRVFQ